MIDSSEAEEGGDSSEDEEEGGGGIAKGLLMRYTVGGDA